MNIEYSSPSPSSQVAGGCRCASQIDLVIRPGRASGGSSHPPDILNILASQSKEVGNHSPMNVSAWGYTNPVECFRSMKRSPPY